MSIVRIVVSSFFCLICVVSASFVQPRGSFGNQNQAPQTQEQMQAREVLNQGVQAFRNGQFEEAIQQFSRAKQLDPRLVNARLYLATTYASLYIPGALSEENRQKGQAAVAEFRGVLNMQADSLSAIDGIGSLLFQMGGQPFDADKFAESKTFHQRHIQISPSDPEPYYWIGVIDWTVSYRANGELRMNYNNANTRHQLRDTDSLPATLREQYRDAYGPTIDEGIQFLKRAIELRPDYDDSMAYLSLLYRRKADTATSQTEGDQLKSMADDLIDKVKEIKQSRASKPPQPPN